MSPAVPIINSLLRKKRPEDRLVREIFRSRIRLPAFASCRIQFSAQLSRLGAHAPGDGVHQAEPEHPESPASGELLDDRCGGEECERRTGYGDDDLHLLAAPLDRIGCRPEGQPADDGNQRKDGGGHA